MVFCFHDAIRGIAGRLAVVAALLLLLAAGSLSARADATLDIEPVAQRTPVWCWLAVGEMVFSHYGVPDLNPVGEFQCGIIGTIAAGTALDACFRDCRFCTIPAGSAANLVWMFEEYPRRARLAGRSAPLLDARHAGRLSRASVVAEIDAGNPVVAGISPSGGGPPGVSQHVALIVGYREDGDVLIVNDPFPYAAAGLADPYEDAGAEETGAQQYAIAYDSLRDDLAWRESVTLAGSAGATQGPAKAAPGDICEGLATFLDDPPGAFADFRGEPIEDDLGWESKEEPRGYDCDVDMSKRVAGRRYYWHCSLPGVSAADAAAEDFDGLIEAVAACLDAREAAGENWQRAAETAETTKRGSERGLDFTRAAPDAQVSVSVSQTYSTKRKRYHTWFSARGTAR